MKKTGAVSALLLAIVCSGLPESPARAESYIKAPVSKPIERHSAPAAPARTEAPREKAAPKKATAASSAAATGPATPVPAGDSSFAEELVAAALDRTRHQVRYDGAYVSISYPGGDVPADTGVCTDVVVRSYRQLGIDLQKEVHEDMRRAFRAYPQIWGAKGPDTNIDHRRVPNLRRFFERHGQSLAVSDNPADYRPGDLVSSVLPGNLPHIMIVTDRMSRDGKRPLVVHNIGRGPKLEDGLFAYPLTGHYHYQP